MMGRKHLAPKLFHALSLEAMVPRDHLLRRLEAAVDLSFVRELCVRFYSHTGQPSVDLVVLFKMMLMGYLYGITSERRLAEECSLHLAFRWYLDYDLDEATPDHSVLSKARARYGKKVFEVFFQRVLQRCVEAGLVGGEKIFADSTLVAANASMQSLVPREALFQPILSASEHLERVFTENPANLKACSESTLSTAGSESREAGDEGGVRRGVPARQRGRKPKPRCRLNAHQVSRTDPDASITSRPGQRALLAYKEHFTVDSRRRVITAVEVTPAAHEDFAPLPQLLAQQPISPQEFCADSHSGVPKVYGELRRRGIRAVIPRRSPQSRQPKPGRLSVSDFHYDAAHDVYVCPQGRELRRAAYESRWDRYHYRPKERDCRGCPLRLVCSTRKTIRTIIHYPNQETIDEALAYRASPAGQRTWAERRVMAEGIVAEAKGFHGLRRALHRGLEKFKIQALLIATVQNLKRLMAAGSAQPGTTLVQNPYLVLQLRLEVVPIISATGSSRVSLPSRSHVSESFSSRRI